MFDTLQRVSWFVGYDGAGTHRRDEKSREVRKGVKRCCGFWQGRGVVRSYVGGVFLVTGIRGLDKTETQMDLLMEVPGFCLLVVVMMLTAVASFCTLFESERYA